MSTRRRRGGRPPKPEADRRSITIRVAVNAAEYERLRQEAAQAGLSLSAFVRSVALRRRVRSRADEQLARDLLSIGRSIHQLNQHADPDYWTEREIQETMRVLRQTLAQLAGGSA